MWAKVHHGFSLNKMNRSHGPAWLPKLKLQTTKQMYAEKCATKGIAFKAPVEFP